MESKDFTLFSLTVISLSSYSTLLLLLCCYCSVTQWYPTVHNPMDCSTPGFPVPHQLLEFAQVHIHWTGDAIQPSHASVILFSSCLQYFWASGSFPMSQIFASGGQSIGASASASVLPVNIQGWFPLGLTGLIALQSKGLSRLFSSTTVWRHQFLVLWLLYVQLLHLYLTTGKTIDLCQQSDIYAF